MYSKVLHNPNLAGVSKTIHQAESLYLVVEKKHIKFQVQWPFFFLYKKSIGYSTGVTLRWSSVEFGLDK